MENCNPGDLYMDGNGRLWRVIGYCAEPSVTMEAVEPEEPMNPAYANQIASMAPAQTRISLYREKMSGGVNGLMWQGFKRIYKSQS